MSRDILIKCKRVGELSSKYAYDFDGSQFEADVKRHSEEYETLYSEFIEFMKSKSVAPSQFRSLFMRYYEDFIEEGGDDLSQKKRT